MIIFVTDEDSTLKYNQGKNIKNSLYMFKRVEILVTSIPSDAWKCRFNQYQMLGIVYQTCIQWNTAKSSGGNNCIMAFWWY